MPPAPLPDREDDRLAALKALQVLDTPPEERFERITRLAARSFGVPIALVSLVDEARQWFKSCFGLDLRETPREQAFCAYALHGSDILVIPNAAKDPRTADNPLVTGAPGIRFYAGAPLITAEGHALGSLCIIDTRPRADFSAEDRSTLRDLAAMTLEELSLRLTEQRLAEARERQAQAEAVIVRVEEVGRLGYFILDTETLQTEYLSPGLFKLARSLDKSSHTVKLTSLLERVYPEDRPRVQDQVEAAIKDHAPLNLEFRALTSQGEIEHLWMTDATLRDRADGRALRVGIVQDVTEARARESELSRSLAFERAVTDVALDCIITIDAQSRIVEFNPAAEKTFGFTRAEALGADMAELIVPGRMRAAHRAGMARYLETGAHAVMGRRIEIEALNRAGREFPVELSINPVKVGGEVFFTAYLRDISERVRTEDELVAKERMLANAQRLARLGSWEWDVAGDHIQWSEETYHIFGVDPARGPLDFNAYMERIHPDDRAMLQHNIEQVFRTGNDYSLEHRIILPDGTVRHVTGRGQATLSARGAVERMHGTVQDITELRMAEDALRAAKDEAEAANSAKSDFLATMSHEMRTPLNGVMGTLTMLRDTPLSPEQDAYVETAGRSAETLLTLINDILDLAKVEAGKLEVEPAPFDPRETLDQALTLLTPVVRERGLALDVTIQDCVPKRLLSDEARIRQIILNLLSNAVKFTEEGTVSVCLCWGGTGPKGSLVFQVGDTGIGIPEDRLGSLFERFSQVDRSRARRFGGSGLGLAICRELTSLLGGTISVESKMGEGSLFTVELPMERCADDTDLPPSEHLREPARLDGRILLAEDSQTNAHVAIAMLRAKGARVDLVGNGIEALEAVRTRPYDLVLMDLSMPEMDGIEATRRIRALPGVAADVPIVALTANALRGDARACFEAGMNDYVTKPIRKAAFLACVARWLQGASASSSVSGEAPAGRPSAQLVDPAARAAIWGDMDGGVYADVVRLFCAELTDRVQAMARALDAAARGDLEREAHAVKSGAANLGATALSERAAALEAAAPSAAWDDLSVQVDALSDWARRTGDHLLHGLGAKPYEPPAADAAGETLAFVKE